MILKSTIKQVFKDEILKICIDSDLGLLRLTWLQHPNSADYRRGYRQGITQALKYNIKYWLTDSRQVLYLPMADQHWMYAKMRPWLKGGKLLKFAIVMQPETFMTTDKGPLLENYNNPAALTKLFNMELFLDMSSAKYWLLEETQGF